MSGNLLRSIPDFVVVLENLVELRFSANRLESFPKIPKNVKIVDLSKNLLSSLRFDDDSNLEYLLVQSNKISSLECLKQASGLVELDASSNSLVEIDLEHKNLKSINLSKNNLKKFVLKQPRLKTAVLNGNNINSLECTLDVELEELYLSENNLSEFPFSGSFRLKQLKTVDISKNSTLCRIEDSISKLIQLKRLDCSDCNLRDAPICLALLKLVEKIF